MKRREAAQVVAASIAALAASTSAVGAMAKPLSDIAEPGAGYAEGIEALEQLQQRFKELGRAMERVTVSLQNMRREAMIALDDAQQRLDSDPTEDV